MKVYLSGKITGLEYSHAEAIFNEAENNLNALGFEVVNPLKISPFEEDKSYGVYMIEDVKALIQCDAIYLLDNWEQSRGARIERMVALSLNKYFL